MLHLLDPTRNTVRRFSASVVLNQVRQLEYSHSFDLDGKKEDQHL